MSVEDIPKLSFALLLAGATAATVFSNPLPTPDFDAGIFSTPFPSPEFGTGVVSTPFPSPEFDTGTLFTPFPSPETCGITLRTSFAGIQPVCHCDGASLALSPLVISTTAHLDCVTSCISSDETFQETCRMDMVANADAAASLTKCCTQCGDRLTTATIKRPSWCVGTQQNPGKLAIPPGEECVSETVPFSHGSVSQCQCQGDFEGSSSQFRFPMLGSVDIACITVCIDIELKSTDICAPSKLDSYAYEGSAIAKNCCEMCGGLFQTTPTVGFTACGANVAIGRISEREDYRD